MSWEKKIVVRWMYYRRRMMAMTELRTRRERERRNEEQEIGRAHV